MIFEIEEMMNEFIRNLHFCYDMFEVFVVIILYVFVLMMFVHYCDIIKILVFFHLLYIWLKSCLFQVKKKIRHILNKCNKNKKKNKNNFHIKNN